MENIQDLTLLGKTIAEIEHKTRTELINCLYVFDKKYLFVDINCAKSHQCRY